MNEVQLEINGKTGTLKIPSCWNEVSKAAYPYLASLYLAKHLDKYQKTVGAFLLFCKEPCNKSKLERQLLPEEMYELLPLVDWVFDKVDLTINLIPVLSELYWHIWRYNTKHLLGPDDGLKNLRFAEWILADTFFCDYSLSQYDDAYRDELLNKLVAVLYRPRGKGDDYTPGKPTYRGDQREKFNDANIDIRAKQVARVPKYIRQAIYLWFASCRQQIIAQYPKVFDADEEDKNKNSLLSGFGWFGIYDDLRGDPKFGGPDRLEEEFVLTIFQSITRSSLKMDQFRRENKI